MAAKFTGPHRIWINGVELTGHVADIEIGSKVNEEDRRFYITALDKLTGIATDVGFVWIKGWEIPQVVSRDHHIVGNLRKLTDSDRRHIIGYVEDRIYRLTRWEITKCSCGNETRCVLQWKRIDDGVEPKPSWSVNDVQAMRDVWNAGQR